MHVFRLILLGRNIMDVDLIYDDMLRLTLTKDAIRAEQSFLELTAIATTQKNEDLNEISDELYIIEEVRNQLEADEQYELLHKGNKSIYVQSKFYKKYNTKFITLEKRFVEEEVIINEITNKYYAPEFVVVLC